MKTDVSHWKYIKRPISITEAALLLAGYEPPDFFHPDEARKWSDNHRYYTKYIEGKIFKFDMKAKRYDLYRDSIIDDILKGELKTEYIDNCHPVYCFRSDPDYINPDVTTISLRTLAIWAINNNEERDFLTDEIEDVLKSKKAIELKKKQTEKAYFHINFLEEIILELKSTTGKYPKNKQVYQRLRQFFNEADNVNGVEVHKTPLPENFSLHSQFVFCNTSGKASDIKIQGSTLLNILTKLRKKLS